MAPVQEVEVAQRKVKMHSGNFSKRPAMTNRQRKRIQIQFGRFSTRGKVVRVRRRCQLCSTWAFKESKPWSVARHVTTCNHVFCERCLDGSTKAETHDRVFCKCPLCRTEFRHFRTVDRGEDNAVTITDAVMERNQVREANRENYSDSDSESDSESENENENDSEKKCDEETLRLYRIQRKHDFALFNQYLKDSERNAGIKH